MIRVFVARSKRHPLSAKNRGLRLQTRNTIPTNKRKRVIASCRLLRRRELHWLGGLQFVQHAIAIGDVRRHDDQLIGEGVLGVHSPLLPHLLREVTQRRNLHVGDASDEKDDDGLFRVLLWPLKNLVVVLAAHETTDVCSLTRPRSYPR